MACVAEAHSAEATAVLAEEASEAVIVEVEATAWAEVAAVVEATATEDVVNTLTSAFIIRCTSDIVQCA